MNVTQVKWYQEPIVVMHSLFNEICRSLSKFCTAINDEDDVFLTEVIKKRDHLAQSKQDPG